MFVLNSRRVCKTCKAEYDNVARIADELGISINETRRLIGEELEKK